MPEYKSFEPVATSDMVNLFDGSFTYNIPLMDVPNGYPISLSYHSNDVNTEALSSWVGLGWTLNPGAVNRMKRGFPDEFQGQKVTYFNKMEKNWTLGAGVGADVEIFGSEGLQLNLGASLHYNNYCGVGTSITGGIGLAGMASLSFDYTNGQFGFDPSINPGKILSFAGRMAHSPKNKSTSDQDQKSKLKAHVGAAYGGFSGALNSKKQVGFSFSTARPTSYPVNVAQYDGFALHLSVDVGVNLLPIPIAPEGKLEGSYSSQTNKESVSLPVYGYMNSEKALANDNSIMDYFTENDNVFEKRDNILGIPLPNNDVYSMTGEAMGGSFRPIRSEYGHYRKNYVKSETYSVQAGADVKLASIFPVIPVIEISNLAYTIGGNLGGDYQYLSVGNWDDRGDASQYDFKDISSYPSSNEKFFFRFSGDLGGNFDLSGNDDPYQASLDNSLFSAVPKFTGALSSTLVDTRSNKSRSTYIDYSSNEDFLSTANNTPYKVAEKSLYVVTASGVVSYDRSAYNSLADADGTAINKSIGEVVTHNPEGMQYVYGLPVYSKNEKELEYSLINDNGAGFDQTDLNTTGGGIIAKINGDVAGHANRKLGYDSPTPYATTYLLTQITSPDYIDRNYNGPSTDDYGNYTRFNYQRVAGGGGTWYPYRSPYKGVNFSAGSLSVNEDDMGSFSSGDKEIYYLHSLVSKTHVAVFSIDDRDDGLSAKVAATENDLLKGDGTDSGIKLKKLNRIDLYSINDVEELKAGSGIYAPKAGAVAIKTVHLEYDYSLCKGVLNNTNYDNTDLSKAGSGKLTLKRVWFEFNGKTKSKISPYVFDYNYPINTSTTYPPIYNALLPDGKSSITNFYAFADADQNPAYNVLNTDRWGSYRNYASLHTSIGDLSRFFPFVNQAPPATDDAGAYLLKRIVLPSGGELHVQYEQNDYMYVQDQRAMMMVPLKAITSQDELNTENKRYYLDLAKVGLNASYTDAELKTIAADMFEPMINKRMYFNFLYALLGDTPNYASTYSDYLEGYARIQGYGKDANGIYFTFKGNSSAANSFFQDIGSGFNKKEIPRQVCLNFYRTQRRAKLSGQANSLNSTAQAGTGEDLVRAFANLVSDLTNSSEDICKKMKPEMSYVRVQVPVAMKRKLGGGVRVKRMLMFDNGVDENRPNALYGQEYKYTTVSNGVEISSGVASNEPSVGRRESPLVNPIEKDEQTKSEAILYGKDMYSQEGPLGESLLPGPSVGYSQVRISNIYTGATSTGSEQHEFYTWKDFPFVAKRTGITQVLTNKTGVSGGVSIGGVGLDVSYTREDPYMTQGYAFISQAMNGHPKRVAKFANGVSSAPLMEDIYEYYKPGENVKVTDGQTIQSVPFSTLGKESEMLSEMRQVADVSTGGEVGVDVTVGPSIWYFPPFLPLVVPTAVVTGISGGFRMSEKILRTHVTSKIINYPAIMKDVIHIADGVRQVTINDVLDKQTGSPVIVKTTDDFTGTYLNQDFMASWNYQSVRSKAINQKITSSGTYGSDGNGGYIQLTAQELNKFTPGDFIEVKASSLVNLYHIKQVDATANQLRLYASQLNTGVPLTGSVSLKVLNSGNTSQLGVKCGNILLHSDTGVPLPILGVPNLSSSLLTTDLNTKLKTISLANGSTGSIVLSGTYDNVSVANYSKFLPSDCSGNANNLTVSNLSFIYSITNNQIKITLNSFKAKCGSTWIDISCL